MLTRAAGFRPAADDELLLMEKLQLPPGWRSAPREIGRLPVLRDEPLPAVARRPVHQRPAIVGHDLAEPHALAGRRRSRFDARLQPEPPRGKRQPPQVGRALAEQIEQHDRGRLLGFGRGDLGRRGQVHPILQGLESQRPARGIDGDDLAVEQDRHPNPARHLGERLGDGGKLPRLVVAIARIEDDPRRRAGAPPTGGRGRRKVHQRPNAVVLGFIHPPGLREGSRVSRGQHGPDPGRVVMPGGHVLILVGRPAPTAPQARRRPQAPPPTG